MTRKTRYAKKLYIAYLRKAYIYFNNVCFMGKLPDIQFGIVNYRRRCYGITYNPPLTIALCLYRNDNEFINTLLHEMIHVKQAARGYEMDHGSRFQREVEKLKWQGFNP